MLMFKSISRATLGTALAVALAAGFVAAAPMQASAQSQVAPTNEITLSVGTGRLVRLPGTMSDIFVASDEIADVQVRSPTQVYIFGKAAGQTTIYATNSAGRVIYSTTVRVGQNLASVDEMLELAMPESNIRATPMNGLVLLTGTVAQPDDAAEAERLAQAFVGTGTQVLSRLRTATPQQVMLKVTIAEVSRSLVRNVGTNILTQDQTGGFLFGIGRGNPGSITDVVSDTLIDPITGNPLVVGTDVIFNNPAGTTTLGAFGRLFGLDVLGTPNLNETNGLVTILAEPTLTSLSGETASFLAGGEFPIPIAQSLGTTTIEYKQFGVGLAFTPYVMENGRISMRVRPEVSELSSAGSIEFNGFEVPSLTVRRTETTVELGSGQSLVIAGLMRTVGNNSLDRTPFLGNVPILGALFRSNNFRRDETELVIVVTPYLVQPVSANQITLPTDGFRTANDAQRLLIGQEEDSRSGETRPMPTAAQPRTVAPGVDGVGSVGGVAQSSPALPPPAPVQQSQRDTALPPQRTDSSVQPGFNL
ncbi:MAG: type II and III secretion system protein family protein [Allosphingosinicella sp.]